MNYPESSAILEKIKASQKILLNCHHNPDPDSVGSALAMSRVLRDMGKEVKILSPSKVSKNLEFLLEHDEQIEETDFKNFNYSEWDLFIANDSSSWSRICGSHDIPQPGIDMTVIDHHKTNQKFGIINLIVPDAPANCELLYYFFQDIGYIPDTEKDYPDIATPLLTGIIGDTGAFRFPEADRGTFAVAHDLMKLTNKNKIIFNLYQSYEKEHVHLWQAIMQNLRIDDNGFVYSFIDNDVMQENGYPQNAKTEIADMIFQSISGTKFGMVGAMSKEGYMSVSFRAREEVDVSVLASDLGGGGHKWAAACRIDEGSFDKNVEKALLAARDFIKNDQNS